MLFLGLAFYAYYHRLSSSLTKKGFSEFDLLSRSCLTSLARLPLEILYFDSIIGAAQLKNAQRH